MRFKTKPETVEKMAVVISDNIKNLDEVDIQKRGKDTLLWKIARALKRTLDQRFQRQVYNLWNDENSSLRMITLQMLKNKNLTEKSGSASSERKEVSRESNSDSDDEPSKKHSILNDTMKESQKENSQEMTYKGIQVSREDKQDEQDSGQDEVDSNHGSKENEALNLSLTKLEQLAADGQKGNPVKIPKLSVKRLRESTNDDKRPSKRQKRFDSL